VNDFTQLVDLASVRLGGRVLEANDEFFAPKENLLKPSKPIFIEGKYTSRGKWMDGWETRRRRTPGFDWCIIRLGLPGVVRGVVVDTSFFKGNFPSHFSLEACDLGSPPYTREKTQNKSPKTDWLEILPKTALEGDSRNPFSIQNPSRFTHLRLKIYPDGGVARLRVHGEVTPDEKWIARPEINLAAIESGARILSSSDQFFGEPLHLLMPGRGKDMSDGWETRRRRGPGFDWVILRLGLPGTIRHLEVDTAHYKGNFPETCSLEACFIEPEKSDNESVAIAAAAWREVLPRTPLRANSRHFLRKLENGGTVSHVRFNIYPDGGVSRLRVFGRPARPERNWKGIQRINQLPVGQARKTLLACCASTVWANEVMALRPFTDEPALHAAAEKVWSRLDRKEWLGAIRRHPPIGGKIIKSRQGATERQWSANEQSAAQNSSPETLAVLRAANQAYRATFGYVFLICATGKGGDEILQSLRQRLANDPETELNIAAEELQKIMHLRLEKLLKS
jgi:allantoicase